nr:protein MKS1-like [Ipomoea batatas]
MDMSDVQSDGKSPRRELQGPRPAPLRDHFNVGGGGAVSPAARFAAVERTRTPQGKKQPIHDVTADLGMIGGMEIMSDVERSGFFPGVLSPNPSSLPPIPPNFFSPPSSDQNPLGFFADFISPGLHNTNTNTNNRNSFETTLFMPSPSTINSFISPGRFLISPGTPSLDFFNNIFDL